MNVNAIRSEDLLNAAKERLSIAKVHLSSDLVFDFVTDRADQVRTGCVFFARRGSQADGHQYIAQAIQHGAGLIVAEVETPELAMAPAYILTRDCAKLYALACALSEGMPQEALNFVGITGTNGKTSTSLILAQILRAQGLSCMVIGTTGIYINGKKVHESQHTTPDPKTFFSLLAKARSENVNWVIMEASSHGLDQARFFPVRFDIAIFTSFSQDHLDYHKTMQHYLEAKLKIFSYLFAKPQARFFASSKIKNLIKQAKPEIADKIQFYDLDEQLYIPKSLQLSLPYQADFLKENSMAALLAAKTITGQWPEQQTIANLEQVAGRMQKVSIGPDATRSPQVFVDYAHTPDALEKALAALSILKKSDSRIFVVFGCGGNRDSGKRPLMGEIAERLADQVIVTNDNPRQESPESIAAAIKSGMKDPEKSMTELDRRQAIRFAIKIARPQDFVLIAGKGHETYQIIGDKTLAFDDANEARIALTEKQHG